MYIAEVYYIPIIGLKTVNLGLASGFSHVLNYITYGDKSMGHLCSFRTLTPLSALVFKMHYHG